jgi:hypothetical protein
VTDTRSAPAQCLEARPSPDGTQSQLASWERWIGHAGYVAEGVVYLLIGGFALFAAVKPQRQPSGSGDIFAKLGAAPLGEAFVAVLAVGLAAFVLWQLLLAIRDPEHKSDRPSLRRRITRLGHFFNGVLYSVLVGEAVWHLLGFGMAEGERSQARWTARAMALPLGHYAVGIVGAGIAMFGLFQFYRAATHSKSKRVDLTRTILRMPIIALSAYGFSARGVLFALLGGYLVDAAWAHNARYSGGIGGALGELKENFPSGAWLLGAVAVGLIAYGLAQIVKERYRLFRDS